MKPSSRTARRLRFLKNLRALWDLSCGQPTWYDDARAWIVDIARRSGLSVEQAAGIVAVLSPAVRWDYQVRETLTWILAERASPGSASYRGYGRNRDKARAVLRGANVDDMVRGPKVRAFWRTLVGPHNVPVIDRWALRAATGRPGINRADTATMADVSAAYAQGATESGVSVSEYQAAIWEIVRK